TARPSTIPLLSPPPPRRNAESPDRRGTVAGVTRAGFHKRPLRICFVSRSAFRRGGGARDKRWQGNGRALPRSLQAKHILHVVKSRRFSKRPLRGPQSAAGKG